MHGKAGPSPRPSACLTRLHDYYKKIKNRKPTLIRCPEQADTYQRHQLKGSVIGNMYRVSQNGPDESSLHSNQLCLGSEGSPLPLCLFTQVPSSRRPPTVCCFSFGSSVSVRGIFFLCKFRKKTSFSFRGTSHAPHCLPGAHPSS